MKNENACYKGVACPDVVNGVGMGRVEGLPLFMVSHPLVLISSPGPRLRAETHSGVQARAFPTTLLPKEWLRQKESPKESLRTFGPSQLGNEQ